MEATRVNLAAGHRTLGARAHTRLLDEQTEALTRIDAADRMLCELINWAREQHETLQSARSFAVAANRRASSAVYEAPEVVS
jgi:hypothetical protein